MDPRDIDQLIDSCLAIVKSCSVTAQDAFQSAMLTADQRFFDDHIYANANLMNFLDPEMSRCVLWKEILSGVIGSRMINDYRAVTRMKDTINTARQAVAAGQNDNLLFRQHNTANTTVLEQIDVFIEEGGNIDNPVLKIVMLAEKLLAMIEFVERKYESLNNVVSNYESLRVAVTNIETLSNRIIKREISYEDAIKTLVNNDEIVAQLMDSYNNFVTTEPPMQVMNTFRATVPNGMDNTNPTIGRMKTWFDENNFMSYCRVRTDRRELTDIQAFRALANRNSSMYTTLFPYRSMDDDTGRRAPYLPPVMHEHRDGRDSRRSSVGSGRHDTSEDLTDRKINRFVRHMKDLRLRLTDEDIEDKSEAVIESLKSETIELDKKYNNIMDHCDDDQEAKLTNIQFGGRNYSTEKVIREWKTDLDDAINEKKQKARDDQYSRKTKEDNAKSILNSNPIVKLERDADYLDFIESVKVVTGQTTENTSDILIGAAIKRALVRDKDKKEVKSLTRTKDILQVISRNYAANKSLISKIISPIINLPDPSSYNKSLENCKEILAFLKRMKENDLEEHLQEQHLANFESRAFYSVRRQMYCSELAKYTAGMLPDDLDEDAEIIAEPRGTSTPRLDCEVSVRITRKKNDGGEKHNSSALDILNLQDRMKRNLSKLAIGKKLKFFKDYLRGTELYFLNEMICSLELVNNGNSKKEYSRNGKSQTVNKTDVTEDKNGRPSRSKGGKRSFQERINDPNMQKSCPTGCGSKHYNGSARFCKAFYELPLEERIETSKKKKLCGKCLCGCFKGGHKGPAECTMVIVCRKCGSNNHNTLLCRKSPELQAFSTEADEDENDATIDLDAYYSQLGLDEPEIHSVNHIQEGDNLEGIIDVNDKNETEVDHTKQPEEEEEDEINSHYVEINEMDLEQLDATDAGTLECNLIEVIEASDDDSEFQLFLNQSFTEDLSADNHSNYFLHHQAKIASEIFDVKWSKMIPVIKSRIIKKIQEAPKIAKFIITECRNKGVTKEGIQQEKFLFKNDNDVPEEELIRIGSLLVMEFISNIKLQPRKLQNLGQCLDLHATAAKKWSKEEWEEIVSNKAEVEERFGKFLVDDEVCNDQCYSPKDEVEVNKISTNHFIPVNEWKANVKLEPASNSDDVILFEVIGKDGTKGEIEVKYSDLGIKLEDCRLDSMPKVEPNSYLSPNENNENYVHLDSEAKGIFKLVHHSLIKQALELHSKYGLTVKGMYLPVLVKIKDVISMPDDVEIVKIEKEGATYVRLILCIDSGSETGLLDESVAKCFVFDSDAATPLNVKLNTVVGSSSERLERQVILFRGTDGVHYPSCALQIARIGKDKMQSSESLEKVCELFQFDHRTKQHFIKNAGKSQRRCHVLISMKEMGSFFEILEPERLNGKSPCISPNTKIIKSVLSDQLIIGGQIGLNYNVAKYQSLFVHKDQLAEELSKITKDKVSVKIVRKKGCGVHIDDPKGSDCYDSSKDSSSWNCHYVSMGEVENSFSWKREQMESLRSQEECESDIEMDIHRISAISKEEKLFRKMLDETDDGGVTAILATGTEAGDTDLSSADYELLNTIRNKLNNDKMSEEKLLGEFSSMNTHNLLVENDHMIHISEGPMHAAGETEKIDELDCCSLQCAEVEKLIQQENDLNLKILCDSCRLRQCPACNLANSHLTMSEKLKYLECWRSTKLIEKDGEIRCQVDFLYQNDPKIIFKKENSNYDDAKRNIDNNIKKLKKKGKLEELIIDVDKKIELGTLTAVTEKEYKWILDNLPHHFSKLHVVHNESSDSTPRRIINNTNTSIANNATSLSAQQLCIKNPLQDDFSILAGFCLHPHPISLDVSKAYLRILVPYETSCLRLFIWYDNPCEMSGLRIFRRTSGDFGDTPMSGGLTLTQRKLLSPACKSSITAAIAKTSNFADNYIDALLSWLGWSTTTNDLVETSKLINLPLKPGATCTATDPDVLAKAEIDPASPTSNLLGLTWNLVNDEVKPNNYFSLKGKSMGTTIGKKLKDMTSEEVKVEMITRELLARVAMQPYDRLGRIGPIISTLRTLLSRACEVVPNNNYKESVINYDNEFGQLCRDYLCRLILFDDIKPFPRSTIPDGHVLYGMCFPSDGGNPAYSAYCYTLSEQSERVLNIHHDWRDVNDPLGVLTVPDDELRILDDPAGISFYSDRKPEVHGSYKSNFGKSIEWKDVTKKTLKEREMQRTQFEKKHDIRPLSESEIELIQKDQTNKNDRLESNLLASRSKNSKRSIPAHEILGRVLASELALSVSRTLSRYSLYALSHITFVFPGDSICSAMLHSPNIEIKNTLLLGGVRKSEANLRMIIEELPKASLWLTWIAGEINPSDFSSKMVFDPISVINSEFFRTGPKQFKSKTGIKEFCYKSYTPADKWQWKGLPESLTKINENATKLKDLLNTSANDPLQNDETKRFIRAKEKEYVECKLCILEEIDDSKLKCDTCTGSNNPSENCSILMITRSQVKAELEKDIPHQSLKERMSKEKTELIKAQREKGISPVTELIKADYGKPENAEVTLCKRKSVSKEKKKGMSEDAYKTHQLKHVKKPKGTNDLSPKESTGSISKNEKLLVKLNSLSNINCLFPDNYEYFLTQPILHKSIYDKFLSITCNWEVTFSLIHNFIRGVISFKQRLQRFKNARVDSFAETWRSIIISSQAHYPAKVLKTISRTTVQKMNLTNFRLSPDAHKHLFKTSSLPIICGQDPLSVKLIRHAHLKPSIFGNSHANQKGTEANCMKGNFGAFIVNVRALVRELSFNCLACNKYREKLARVKMGDISVRISAKPRPFQTISIDPLGHTQLKPWVDARTSILCYPLLIKCLETSAINAKIMFKNDTRHVIMKLLELESDFAVKIKHISVDDGTNLIIENINPAGGDKNPSRLFEMLKSSKTALPQAQMQNIVESGVKIFKSYIKKTFQLTKDGKIPALCADEWAFILSFVCNQINDIPYILDNEGYMLSPNDLVHFSPLSAVGNFEASSHFQNIREFLQRAKDHYKILQEAMLETSINQCERFRQLDHNKKNGIKDRIQEGNLVGWRNSQEKFNSGVIIELKGSKAVIKDKLGNKHEAFTGNLVPLASIKYSDFQQSLRERYQD